MIRSWLSYLEHAVEQAQQASNAQYQLFRDPQVFDDARRAIQERLESLRPGSRTDS